MEYRLISSEVLTPALFDSFHRRQIIQNVWHLQDGQWVIDSAPRLIENWGKPQHEFICHCLRETLTDGGVVCGAFDEDKLKGIVAVNAVPLGSRGQYREIPFLHVSEEYRGQSIGRTLFTLAKGVCRELGGEMLFISSQPSVETQAFYKAMGCRDATESSAAHIQRNPQERQLECNI